jgi:hypothetical protein
VTDPCGVAGGTASADCSVCFHGIAVCAGNDFICANGPLADDYGLNLNQELDKQAPGFDKNNWPNLSEQKAIIYEFYGVHSQTIRR